MWYQLQKGTFLFSIQNGVWTSMLVQDGLLSKREMHALRDLTDGTFVDAHNFIFAQRIPCAVTRRCLERLIDPW